jgi:hypothetical protein
MDRTSSANFSQNAIQAVNHDSALMTLPSDVLPNIFSRMPVSDLFASANVSKQVQHVTQALLPEATGRELHALTLDEPRDFEDRLAVLLRVGGHHITDEDWTDFLQAVESSKIYQRLVVVLLLSLARQDAALRKHPGTTAIAASRIESCQIEHSKDATLICAAGMKQLMHLERLGGNTTAKPIQLSTSHGWKQLVDLFKMLGSVAQVNLLLQVRPREKDGENIRLAFDELVDMHLASLVESGGFPFMDRLLWQEPPKRAAYFDILADAYTMARSPEQVSYFQEMRLGSSPHGLVSGPWRQDMREHCRFVFRLLAYETRTNLDNNQDRGSNAIQRAVVPVFLGKAELKDFTAKLDVRIDRGMLLEDAVDMWIEENRNAGKCVIS